MAGVAALAAGISSSALGASVKIQRHDVPVIYDEHVWTTSTDEEGVNFNCGAESCGGKDAICSTYSEAPKAADKAKEFFNLYIKEIMSIMVEEYEKQGNSPAVIDPPARTFDGGRFSDRASIRFVQNGATWRIWFAVIQEPFGVTVLNCSVDESRFVASEPELRKLANSLPAGRP